MSIEFRCSNCDKKLKTGDDKAGKTAKCPQCGMAVTVPAASMAEADDFGGFPSFDEPAAVSPVVREKHPVGPVACSMCGASNDAAATRCFACGEDLRPAAAADPRAYSLQFGDVWQRAWEIWTANLGINVAAMLIATLSIFAGYFICLVLPMMVGFGLAAAAGNNNGGAMIAILFALMGLGYLVLIGVALHLQLGLSNFALRQVRHGDISLGNLFPSLTKLPVFALSMIVLSFAMMVVMIPAFGTLVIAGAMMEANNEGVGLVVGLFGYGLAVVAGLLVAAVVWPVPYMIADRTSGLVSALVDGPKLAFANLKLSLLLVLVNVALVLVGELACGIGLLFTYSLSFLLFAVAYDRCEKTLRA